MLILLNTLYLILLLIEIEFVKVGHHYHASTRLLSGLFVLFEITAAHRQPTVNSVLPTDMLWSPTLRERAQCLIVDYPGAEGKAFNGYLWLRTQFEMQKIKGEDRGLSFRWIPLAEGPVSEGWLQPCCQGFGANARLLYLFVATQIFAAILWDRRKMIQGICKRNCTNCGYTYIYEDLRNYFIYLIRLF